jgi:hypothetical protein
VAAARAATGQSWERVDASAASGAVARLLFFGGSGPVGPVAGSVLSCLTLLPVASGLAAAAPASSAAAAAAAAAVAAAATAAASGDGEGTAIVHEHLRGVWTAIPVAVGAGVMPRVLSALAYEDQPLAGRQQRYRQWRRRWPQEAPTPRYSHAAAMVHSATDPAADCLVVFGGSGYRPAAVDADAASVGGHAEAERRATGAIGAISLMHADEGAAEVAGMAGGRWGGGAAAAGGTAKASAAAGETANGTVGGDDDDDGGGSSDVSDEDASAESPDAVTLNDLYAASFERECVLGAPTCEHCGAARAIEGGEGGGLGAQAGGGAAVDDEPPPTPPDCFGIEAPAPPTAPAAGLLRCSRCRERWYCSLRCQAQDWWQSRHWLACCAVPAQRGGRGRGGSGSAAAGDDGGVDEAAAGVVGAAAGGGAAPRMTDSEGYGHFLDIPATDFVPLSRLPTSVLTLVPRWRPTGAAGALGAEGAAAAAAAALGAAAVAVVPSPRARNGASAVALGSPPSTVVIFGGGVYPGSYFSDTHALDLKQAPPVLAVAAGLAGAGAGAGAAVGGGGGAAQLTLKALCEHALAPYVDDTQVCDLLLAARAADAAQLKARCMWHLRARAAQVAAAPGGGAARLQQEVARDGVLRRELSLNLSALHSVSE